MTETPAIENPVGESAPGSHTLIDRRSPPAEPVESRTETAPANVGGPDISGIVWPGPAGSEVDALAARFAHGLWRRTEERLRQYAEGAKTSWEQHVATRTLAALDDTHPSARLAAFSHAAASLALCDGNPDSLLVEEAFRAARFLAAAPGAAPLELVLPERALGENGIYFPHANTVLHAGHGPVAVRSDADGTVFTWTDGRAVTAPAEAPKERVTLAGHRATILPEAAGLSVMNGTPDIAGGIAEVSPPPDPVPASETIELFREGATLLNAVWPEAWQTSRRLLNAMIIQPQDGEGTTSITVGRLQGALILSVRDAAQVGDAICHEGSHARLSLLFHVDPLIEDDGAETHPSPWRADKRPLKGLLNGLHSFVNVCAYYRRLGEVKPEYAEGAARIHDLQAARVREAWAYFAPRAKPTAMGQAVLEEIEQAVKAL